MAVAALHPAGRAARRCSPSRWRCAPLRAVLGGAEGRALLPVLRDTGRLELAYGLLLGLGLAFGPLSS